MSDVDIKRLKDFESLFRGLTDKELKHISGIMKRKDVNTGKIIINEGETGNELFLLEEGVVDVNKTLTIVTSKNEFGTKERSFIRLTGENHCAFGEMALFGNGERSATVKAVTKCKLFVLESEDFINLCKEYPQIGYTVVTNIALILSAHLRKTNDDVIKLTTALSLALSG
ncbi:cyclic nucleotide-binding domain-containing protein [Candidatus Latescibacterota bacterium]